MCAVDCVVASEPKKYNSQHLAHIFWSFVVVGLARKLAAGMEKVEAIEEVLKFKAQEASNVVQRSGKAGYVWKVVCQTTARAATDCFIKFVPQDFANVW